MAAAAGIIVILIAAVAGPTFLGTFFGPDFIAAQGSMLLLGAAATLTIAGFGFDPALYAMGRPGIPLQVNTAAVAISLPVLALLTPRYGAFGAGAAGLIAAVTVFVAMGVFTFHSVAPEDWAAADRPSPGNDARRARRSSAGSSFQSL